MSEWTIDWIACLLAAKLAGDRFNVVELGAGYGQWMVTAILAYKQLHPSKPVSGIALEADRTHFRWLKENALFNLGRYDDVETLLLERAAGLDGVVEFPEIADPTKDYGAAYGSARHDQPMRNVECFSLPSIYALRDASSVDLLHCDIQGAESDLISHPEFSSTLSRTKVVLFGTHRSEALHSGVKDAVIDAGLRVVVDWPRNASFSTPYGEIHTNDGAILGVSPGEFDKSCEFVDFDALCAT